MKINALFLLTVVCSYTTLFAQVELDTVVAQKGDGIFSILRRSGIHPVNYYVDFLELNKDNIRGASELVVGRKYVLPHAPDSYKNMGTLVHVDGNEELPLFTTDLAGIKQRDSTLKNTVYHLIYPTIKTKKEEKSPLDEFILKVSKDLMERGARVYVFQKNNMIFPVDTAASEVERAIAAFGELTSMVNKKYLKHNGSYQRVLMIRDVNRNKNGVAMAMYHYGKSADGKHLAATFRDIFKKNALGKVKIEQGISPFTDAPNIYLAKNLLPSLTIMDINGDMNGIPIRSRKSALPGLITEGILQDYATVNSTD